MIREPVILVSDGGAEIFRTKEEAECYAEPVDIENGEYVAYDAAGRLLKLRISQDGFRGELALLEPSEDRGEQLADELWAFLANVAAQHQVPFDVSHLREYSSRIIHCTRRLTGVGLFERIVA